MSEQVLQKTFASLNPASSSMDRCSSSVMGKYTVPLRWNISAMNLSSSPLLSM
jgi:hypothetical protein